MPARSLETWTDFKGEGHLTDVTTKFRPQAHAGMPSSSVHSTSVRSFCGVLRVIGYAFACRLNASCKEL